VPARLDDRNGAEKVFVDAPATRRPENISVVVPVNCPRTSGTLAAQAAQ
jgi:hypothetical protein